MTSAAATIALCDAELAYLRFICELFPVSESPLHWLVHVDEEQGELAAIHAALAQRQLLGDDGIGASPDLAWCLKAVSECTARVSVVVEEHGSREQRDFYISARRAVQYQHTAADSHLFGPAQDEVTLATELALALHAKPEPSTKRLELSAGDYLVFALFARDVRSAPAATGPDVAMSADEVLAHFDEPGGASGSGVADDSWQLSLRTLVDRGILIENAGSYELAASLHPLARELVADRRQTIVRVDYFDEHWLTREVHLYPTNDAVYRLGTQPDGAVVIEELSAAELEKRIRAVVTELAPLRRQ